MSDILCAGHAIKEVLSAGETLAALESGVRTAGENIAGSYLLSDGGDGFLEACQPFCKGELIEVECTAPLGDAITAPFLYDSENQEAYIEMALCSGLNLVEPQRRNIMISGTSGLGDMVAAAKSAGAKRIYIGLGGSATCDGGIGFLWKLADHASLCAPGTCEPRVALDLPELSAPDIEKLREWLGHTELVALVDVNNPLLGSDGAALVFAPQKGADPEQVDQLDAWMTEWCQRVQRNAGTTLCKDPGTGAAGGMGFAVAVLGGKLLMGAKAISELSGLSAAMPNAGAVITTEGRFDATSFGGKAPWTAALEAREHGLEAVIFCGVSDESAAAAAAEQGVRVVEFARDLPEDQRRSQSQQLLQDAVADYLKDRHQANV